MVVRRLWVQVNIASHFYHDILISHSYLFECYRIRERTFYIIKFWSKGHPRKWHILDHVLYVIPKSTNRLLFFGHYMSNLITPSMKMLTEIYRSWGGGKLCRILLGAIRQQVRSRNKCHRFRAQFLCRRSHNNRQCIWQSSGTCRARCKYFRRS